MASEEPRPNFSEILAAFYSATKAHLSGKNIYATSFYDKLNEKITKSMDKFRL